MDFDEGYDDAMIGNKPGSDNDDYMDGYESALEFLEHYQFGKNDYPYVDSALKDVEGYMDGWEDMEYEYAQR
jgi:hypothetical protein